MAGETGSEALNLWPYGAPTELPGGLLGAWREGFHTAGKRKVPMGSRCLVAILSPSMLFLLISPSPLNTRDLPHAQKASVLSGEE